MCVFTDLLLYCLQVLASGLFIVKIKMGMCWQQLEFRVSKCESVCFHLFLDTGLFHKEMIFVSTIFLSYGCFIHTVLGGQVRFFGLISKCCFNISVFIQKSSPPLFLEQLEHFQWFCVDTCRHTFVETMPCLWKKFLKQNDFVPVWM